jgi:hypothetical protein
VEIAAPVLSNLEVDCSSTAETCFSNGLDYPVSFNVINASDCIASAEKSPPTAIGTAGVVSSVTLNGDSASFLYTSGTGAGKDVVITITCNNNGGSTEDSVTIHLY